MRCLQRLRLLGAIIRAGAGAGANTGRCRLIFIDETASYIESNQDYNEDPARRAHVCAVVPFTTVLIVFIPDSLLNRGNRHFIGRHLELEIFKRVA